MANGSTSSSSSTPAQLKHDIRKAMSDVGLTLPPDMLSKCASMAQNLSLSPTQLAESWEAHSINRSISELTDLTFSGFRNDILKDLESSNPDVVTSMTSGAVMERGAKRQVGAAVQTPVKKIKREESARVSMSPSRTTPVPTTPSTTATPRKILNTPKYTERTNSGQVVEVYNPHSLPSLAPSSSSISLEYDDLKKYRFMFTTPQERAKALDEHLVQFGEVMQEEYGIQEFEDLEGEQGEKVKLERVGVPRQEVVCCVGRICNEAHEGKINRTSLLLEGSRYHSNGTRINLDISPLLNTETKSPYSLFPGQIVAVEGINASGRKMVVHKLHEGVPPPKVGISAGALRDVYKEGEESKGIKIVTSAGPYTTSDDLEYDPFIDLLQQIRETRPDVAILTGPFVDVKHPKVQNGQVEIEVEEGVFSKIPHEALFAQRISEMLVQLFEEEGEELGTQFVIVPHLDDAVAECVYPQPPLSDRLSPGGKILSLPHAEAIDFGSLGLHHIETAGRTTTSTSHKRIHCVPNPCTLRINEVTIGITSTDVLFHMSRDETSGNLEPGSRLTRLTEHLLQQQSYYPLYPPPLADPKTQTSVNLDLAQMSKWSMPCQPDVLIVPSKLKTFAKKVLDGTVAINPGQLSRGSAGGTYAVLDVHPLKRAVWEEKGDDEEVDCRVGERVSVEIKRI